MFITIKNSYLRDSISTISIDLRYSVLGMAFWLLMIALLISPNAGFIINAGASIIFLTEVYFVLKFFFIIFLTQTGNM